MRHISQESRRIMGCDVVLTLVSDKRDMATIFEDMWQQIVDFDDRFSRFKPTSELSKLNKSAGKKFKASAEMGLLLGEAKKMMAQTSGLFNPFILPALQTAGYIKSLETANANLNSDDYSSLPKGVDHKISTGHNWVEIPKNSAIDLGGIAKAISLINWQNICKSKI